MKYTQGSAHIPPAPLPTVHLNGTAKEDLSRSYYYASRALRTFREAFSESICHGRDYYVSQDPQAFINAREVRATVFGLVGEIEKYLADHIYHISED
jgi:hypothetical protein